MGKGGLVVLFSGEEEARGVDWFWDFSLWEGRRC